MDYAARVKSVKDYVEVVCRSRDEWIVGASYFDPWFRGQENVGWPLEPNIFRFGLLKDEDEIRGEFRRKAPQYMTEPPPQDYWGWYILMQHYGAPTRLLDWTDSALVALFFALNGKVQPPPEDGQSPLEDAADAVVWMLDPWWLNKTVTGDESIQLADFDWAKEYLDEIYESIDRNGNTNIEPPDPVAVDPQFLARRVAVQRSHFTIFGHSRDGLTRLAQKPGGHLIKIAIARESAPRMRADLLTLGISDTSIYPDLKGLSDELTRYRLGTWPPE